MSRQKRGSEPPGPDTDLRRPRLRTQRVDSREPIPWKWLGLGVLVAILGLGLAIGIAAMLLTRPPLNVSVPTPTVIRLTAPPSPQPSATSDLPTATTIPTFTPPPTPDRSVAPETVTAGYYAAVANTGDIGVSLRAGPSTDNLRLELVSEETRVLVLAGPEEGGGFSWWEVRLPSGSEGWIAADFLVPAAEP
ncbi:MAG: SH3 domain-containing protein [Candidatus Promineifilaceae bacterium]|nr:SH3 domain-containing protein [Candidatus Promineifilaceae bacterium]